MDLEKVQNAVTSRAGRQLLLAKKHSPELLFGFGILGVVGAGILACRATLKVEHVLEQAEWRKARARNRREESAVKIKLTGDLFKLYAPAIGLGVVSVAALTGSHVTLNRRNASLTAAYAALDRSFKEYEKRVKEEFGEEKARDLRYGLEDVTEHDTEKGLVHVKKMRAIRGDLSPYARYFDRDTAPHAWQPVPEYNFMFIRANQNSANQQLQTKGFVLLNDVYDGLGLDRTTEGCIIGWVKNSKVGDGFIDFGLFRDDNMEQVHAFMTGDEGGIWLDFNVDGVVFDLIGRGR